MILERIGCLDTQRFTAPADPAIVVNAGCSGRIRAMRAPAPGNTVLENVFNVFIISY